MSVIGRIDEVKGCSLFIVELIDSNSISSGDKVRAKPMGTLCDMRKHIKKENKLVKGLFVNLQKLDFNIKSKGNYNWIIVSKLTKEQVKEINERQKSSLKFDDDMFEDSSDNDDDDFNIDAL
jgi:hypothetical protein